MINLEIELPDGTEICYGEVDSGFAPQSGEEIRFTRTDRRNVLEPDSSGLEALPWIVRKRTWTVRQSPLGHEVFLHLKLRSPDANDYDGE